MRRVIFLLSLLLLAGPASAFANDLYQDGIIYDFKDFAVFASYWMDDNCSQSDWCNGCDFDMSDSVDYNDLGDFAGDWLFVTAEDLAAIDAARDAADAGFEHAKLYMIESWKATTNRDLWRANWYDPAAAEIGYSFGPAPQGDAEFQYDIYKGDELIGYEIVSTGTAGNVTHTVHASMIMRGEYFYFPGSGIGADGSIDIRLNGGLYVIPTDEKLTIHTNSVTSPPSGGIVFRNGLTVPGDVVIGIGGDVNEVVVAKHGVVIEGEVKSAWGEIEYPPVIPPVLPPGVLTQDQNDPNVWLISADGEFGPLNIGTTASDPAIIKIDGNNGIGLGGEPIPLDVYINGDLVLGAAAQLIITQGSAVNLYLGGVLEAKNGSIITYEAMPENPDPVADIALIVEAAKSLSIMGTDSCGSISLRNAGDLYAQINAPQAMLELGLSGDFYGGIIFSSQVEVSNSGNFYCVAPLFDFPDVEVLYMGVKHGSWWEDFAGQTDKVKETFESVVRKSARSPREIGMSTLTVYYYSVPNTTGDPDLEPDRFATFYLSGTHLMLETGTIAGGGETMEIVAENVADVQFSASTGSPNIEMTVTFIDRTVDYSALPHN